MLALARTLAALAALGTALPALADVNIYSTRQPELIQPLLDAFTRETGIATNMVYLDKGLIERLKAEGDRSPADLILTVDIANLAGVVEAGVTQPVESPAIAANIPAEFRDPANQWFGLTARARVIYASKDRVSLGEITSYEDLTDPKWQGRICIRPGTHPYNVALVASVITHLGEKGAEDWLNGLKANLARKPQGNDRAQAKAIWAGECDIGIGNTYYIGLMGQNPEEKPWADAVRVVFPVFRGGGTHLNLSGMAMTKSAPNRAEALKLMEFLTSAPAQSLYAELNFEFPLRPSVERSATVRGWGDFTPDTASLADVAGNRALALKIVERTGFDN